MDHGQKARPDTFDAFFFSHQRPDYPPYPENNLAVPLFPEQALLNYLDNTWKDTAKAVFNNWLGKVYQITNQDRRLPFMEGVDPKNPLNLHNY